MFWDIRGGGGGKPLVNNIYICIYLQNAKKSDLISFLKHDKI